MAPLLPFNSNRKYRRPNQIDTGPPKVKRDGFKTNIDAMSASVSPFGKKSTLTEGRDKLSEKNKKGPLYI